MAHSRSPIDREIATLRALLLDMAARVDEQLTDATNALLAGDVAQAEKVAARDDAIDALELRIDRQCERVLALHAPVAADLRMFIVAVKINTDLERIGDHCRNLARYTAPVAAAPGIVSNTNLRAMADMARLMLRETESAFLTRDRLRARKVIARDLQVNRMHARTFRYLVDECVRTTTNPDAVAHLLHASKALERISDHIKNVAQSIVFLIEGTDLRHGGAAQSLSKGPTAASV
ncbi:phosphate signaling complex protein PhoU [Salisaeta longa]|uniref:phosphate signaling complex protein PhoU n=1 Tax=Salisaeta longa TaxID=503170 RepID=UPI0003B2E1CD|nr:phosphate signaling complex protein PhoU [Salisaeta longa]